MRILMTAALWLSFTAHGVAFERARVLLSDHAVLCTPNTPEAAVIHLVRSWGAMVYLVSSDVQSTDFRLRPWVADHLYLDPTSEGMLDSLHAWKTRLHIGTAVITAHPNLAETARDAGLRVFVQMDEFQQGELALRDGDDFLYYDGPSPIFFERQGALLETGNGSLRSRSGWNKLASALSEAFAPGADTSQKSWHTLLAATHTADSLAALPDADPRSTAFPERWRNCLSWWLAPTLEVDSLHLYVGQKQPHSIRLKKGQGVVTLAGIHADPGKVAAAWTTSLPLTLDCDTTRITGQFSAMEAGAYHWTGSVEFQFENFRFVRPLSILVHVESALRATLRPWVMFENKSTKPDRDPLTRTYPGELELRNTSGVPLEVHLEWQVPSPGLIADAESGFEVAPGERKRTAFTLRLPEELPEKEYDFEVQPSADGASYSVRGQVWKDAPAKSGQGRIGVVGASGAWLSAFPDLGLKMTELSPGSVAGHLESLDAVLIRGGTRPADESDKRAVADFVAEGHVAVIEIESDALTWLPWPVDTVRKPAPFAASFHREEMAWWQSPNGLVGGCFASITRDTLLTLAAGVVAWDPLLVDDHGKGFMYRRASGRGWYVLVHSGWWPRLDQFERRAYLGLFNLVSAGTQ